MSSTRTPRWTGSSATACDQGANARADDTRLLTPAFAGIFESVLVFFVASGLSLPATPLYVAGPLLGDDLAVELVFLDVAFGVSPAVLGFSAGSTGYPATFLISAIVAAVGAAWLFVRGRLFTQVREAAAARAG